MKGIATTLRATAFEIYFVVPGGIYDDFKPQKFRNEKSDTSGNVPSVVSDIKQYVLKVVFKAAHTGASPRKRHHHLHLDCTGIKDSYYLLVTYTIT